MKKIYSCRYDKKNQKILKDIDLNHNQYSLYQ